MGKKKDRQRNHVDSLRSRISSRKLPKHQIRLFERYARHPGCLYQNCSKNLEVDKLDVDQIHDTLIHQCPTIEHQMVCLRKLTQLDQYDLTNRVEFVRNFLNCLYEHHEVFYEGTLFGSTVNGLGFHDSDIDLRIKALYYFPDSSFYEPCKLAVEDTVNTLKNIAHQTTRCSPCIGEFVPSTRCPVAKLTFMTGCQSGNYFKDNLATYQEGLKCDISMKCNDELVSLNSKFIRFLCHIEPKFHILATVIRYWSQRHNLIKPGLLSSYALANMLIFFCQQTQPPLLPTVDEMRRKHLEYEDNYYKNNPSDTNGNHLKNPGILRSDWNCLVSFRKECYSHYGKNNELVSILLLKFFEFYLNFPYVDQIITIRTGKSMTSKEFKSSSQYHPIFPVKGYLNIQDPFDMSHNLTCGMGQRHFEKMIRAIRLTYETLFLELLNNFERPMKNPRNEPWGLTTILIDDAYEG